MVSLRDVLDEVKSSTRRGVWHSSRTLAEKFKTAHKEILNHFGRAEKDSYFFEHHRWLTHSDMLMLRIAHEHGLRSLSERVLKELERNIPKARKEPEEPRIVNTEERPDLSKEKAPVPDIEQIVEIIKQVVDGLRQQKGGEPTKEEIAQILGVSVQDLESLLSVLEQAGVKLL